MIKCLLEQEPPKVEIAKRELYFAMEAAMQDHRRYRELYDKTESKSVNRDEILKEFGFKESFMKNYWLNKDRNKMSVDTARQIAARIWCDKEFKTQVMDPKACEEIARILLKVANK